MKSGCLILMIALTGILLEAQSPSPHATKQAKAGSSTAPATDELTRARDISDQFLSGLKIAAMPEGKTMMEDQQWITGTADFGERIYSRPRFTAATPLFEKLYETDVTGVQEYRRLMDMTMVSQAGTPILRRYLIIEFKDRTTQKWKVLETISEESDHDLDLEWQVAYFSERHKYRSDLDHFLSYGQWLLVAGRIREAQAALTTASTSNANPGIPGMSVDPIAEVKRKEAAAFLKVIDSSAGGSASGQ